MESQSTKLALLMFSAQKKCATTRLAVLPRLLTLIMVRYLLHRASVLSEVPNEGTEKQLLDVALTFSKVLRGRLKNVLSALDSESEFDLKKMVKSIAEMARFATWLNVKLGVKIAGGQKTDELAEFLGVSLGVGDIMMRAGVTSIQNMRADYKRIAFFCKQN